MKPHVTCICGCCALLDVLISLQVLLERKLNVTGGERYTLLYSFKVHTPCRTGHYTSSACDSVLVLGSQGACLPRKIWARSSHSLRLILVVV